MIVNIVFTHFFNTGFFTDDCHALQVHTTPQKTWTQFKVDFSTAHREFRLTNQAVQQLGFRSANMIHDD
jgi:hypothetical protein